MRLPILGFIPSLRTIERNAFQSFKGKIAFKYKQISKNSFFLPRKPGERLMKVEKSSAKADVRESFSL